VSDAEKLLVTVNGRRLAPAWLAVNLAFGTHKDDALTWRTTAVEFHRDGLRLTCLDRYMVLTTWVPALGCEKDDPPDLDEGGERTMVVRDVALRARSLMDYTWGLPVGDGDDNENAIEVDVGISDQDHHTWRGAGQLEMDGLAGEALTFDVPNRERLRVGVYEGEWPPWRKVFGDFVPKRTTAVALDTGRLAQLSKLGPIVGSVLALHWGGPNKAAKVSVGEGSREVAGMIMPIMWRFGLDVEPEAQPEGAVEP
jgi:hypothetical protein